MAQLLADDSGWTLEVGGVRHSHVGRAGEPPALASVRWMLAALAARPTVRSGRVAHLGGGLLTLPRALAERDPRVRQLVVELDPVLAALNRDRFGLPGGVQLEVADARAWLDGAATSPAGAYDAVVIDVFVGGRIPAAFTSRECFAGVRTALAPGGVLVVNSVAGGGLSFLRRELATLSAGFAHVALIVQGSALHGLRFGNATLIASDAPLAVDDVRAELAGDASKGALVTDLAELVGDAAAVTDADALWSPVPDLPDYSGVLRLLDQATGLGRALRSGLEGTGPASDG